jgi:nicotinamide mononucleotide adenylyltransferase
MSEEEPQPPETFIGTNGKIIRKVRHGIVRSTESNVVLSTIVQTDPQLLIIQLKEAERKKKQEEREIERKKKEDERKVERMINAEELKRQKSRNATNKLLDEIGLDPRYRLK